MSGSRTHKVAPSYQRVTWTTKSTSRGPKDRQTLLKSTPRRSAASSPCKTPTAVNTHDGGEDVNQDPLEPLALPKSKVSSSWFINSNASFQQYLYSSHKMTIFGNSSLFRTNTLHPLWKELDLRQAWRASPVKSDKVHGDVWIAWDSNLNVQIVLDIATNCCPSIELNTGKALTLNLPGSVK